MIINEIRKEIWRVGLSYLEIHKFKCKNSSLPTLQYCVKKGTEQCMKLVSNYQEFFLNLPDKKFSVFDSARRAYQLMTHPTLVWVIWSGRRGTRVWKHKVSPPICCAKFVMNSPLFKPTPDTLPIQELSWTAYFTSPKPSITYYFFVCFHKTLV